MGKAISIAEYERKQNNLKQIKSRHINQHSYHEWDCYSSSLQLKPHSNDQTAGSPSKQINFSKWVKVIQYFIRKTYRRYSPFVSMSDISIMIYEYINSMYFLLNWTLHNELSWNVRNSFKIIQIDEEPVKKGIHCWRISTQRSCPYTQHNDKPTLSTSDKADYILWGIAAQPHKGYYYHAPGVYGVSHNLCWIPEQTQCRVNKTSRDLDYFRSNTNIEQVDIILDLERNYLLICVVGNINMNINKSMDQIVIFDNLDESKEGWLPFVALHGYKNKWVKSIAKIPCEWFGKQKMII